MILGELDIGRTAGVEGDAKGAVDTCTGTEGAAETIEGLGGGAFDGEAVGSTFSEIVADLLALWLAAGEHVIRLRNINVRGRNTWRIRY